MPPSWEGTGPKAPCQLSSSPQGHPLPSVLAGCPLGSVSDGRFQVPIDVVVHVEQLVQEMLQNTVTFATP